MMMMMNQKNYRLCLLVLFLMFLLIDVKLFSSKKSSRIFKTIQITLYEPHMKIKIYLLIDKSSRVSSRRTAKDNRTPFLDLPQLLWNYLFLREDVLFLEKTFTRLSVSSSSSEDACRWINVLTVAAFTESCFLPWIAGLCNDLLPWMRFNKDEEEEVFTCFSSSCVSIAPMPKFPIRLLNIHESKKGVRYLTF